MRSFLKSVRHAFQNSAPRRRRPDQRRTHREFQPLEQRLLLAADFALLQDVNTEPGSGLPYFNDPDGSSETIGETTYFLAETGAYGEELWKTDGTEAGTSLVKDIWPGNPGSSIQWLTNVNGTLFFHANDGVHGRELWKSDGTEAGTVLVRDIQAGASSGDPTWLTNFNGTLFFSADKSEYGEELWMSDGTEAGTTLVKDIIPGSTRSDPIYLTVIGNTLFFTAGSYGSGNERELWKSDGTEAGTVEVADIHPTDSSSPANFVNLNGTLYFTADDGTHGRELWKSDGTAATTSLVADIVAGSTDGLKSYNADLTATELRLFFNSNNDLWVSDGTEAGTEELLDGYPTHLVAAGNYVYFSHNDPTWGRELWRSNGTPSYTNLVADLWPGEGDGSPSDITVVENRIYFTADTPYQGREVWTTYGSTQPTRPVKDIMPGPESSDPRGLFNANGALMFTADDGVHGTELWRSLGTVADTTLVADVYSGTASSNIQWLAEVNGVPLFTAYTPDLGYELYREDPVTKELVLLKDLSPGPNSSVSSNLDADGFAIFGNTMYFVGFGGDTGRELWKTDGTADGTVLVKDITEGASSTDIARLTPVGNTLFFVAETDAEGIELWKSDGTAAGTDIVKDIQPGPGDGLAQYSYIGGAFELVNVSGTLFFAADDGTNGVELWVSDGTVGGTVLLRDIRPGSSDSDPNKLTNVNGRLFFEARDPEKGDVLWTSDGSVTGTKRVQSEPTWTSPEDLTEFNGLLYYRAYGQDSEGNPVGQELHVSDGTEAGTKIVTDLYSGSPSASPHQLVNVAGTLYFVARTNTTGFEIWKSDGTAAGTELVEDLTPGDDTTIPSQLTNVNGLLFFTHNHPDYGPEAWYSDGTAAGTQHITTANGTRGYHSPTSFFGFDGREFLTAISDDFGTEIFEVFRSADYGDANTLTTHSDNGARHQPVGIRLGELRDVESDATTSGSADGDDTDGSDDEDGVTFGRLVRGRSGTVTLDIRDAGSGGFADAWVDFNGDADWNDPGEQVLTAESVANGFHEFSFHVPFDAVPGNTASRVRVSRSGGLQPTGLALTGEVEDHQVVIMQDATVSAESRNGSDSLRVRRTGANIEFRNNTTGDTTLWPLNTLNSLTVLGADNENDTLSIDLKGSGFWGLPDGITFNAGDGGQDTVSVILPSTARGTFSQSTPASRSGDLQFRDANSFSDISVSGINYLAVGDHQKFDFLGDTLVAGTTLSVSTDLPMQSGDYLTVSSAQISSAATLAVKAGSVLRIGGTVNAPVAAELGSEISVFSTSSLGRTDSPHGFATRGQLSVGSASVTLNDANQAVLGSLTSLGSGSSPGTVNAANGLVVDFGNNVTGYGTLNTPDDVTKLLMVNGTIVGNSASEPVTLTGRIKGVGHLDNVNITGTYSPGFSPAVVYVGSVAYDSTSTTVLEIGGTDPGSSGYDRIAHSGTATLGGTLDIRLINDFTPDAGDSFVLMTGASITGNFDSVLTPDLPAGLSWNVSVSGSTVTATVESGEPSELPTITGPVDSTRSLRPTITWDAVSGATEYEVWVKNQSTGENPSHQATVSGTSYTPDVDFGIGRFNLWMRAKNAEGNGPWTSQYNFSIDTRADMHDPGRYLNTHTPTLTWDPLPGAVTYDLWINDKLGGISQYVRDQDVSGTSWTPAEDMPLGLYHAWIRGIAADGSAGGWSVTTIFYVMPSPTMTAGMNPTFDRTPTFAWDELTGAVKYEVFIRDRITGGTELYQQNISGLSFTPPSSLTNGPYRVWVIGVSDANVRSYWTAPMDVYIGGRTDVLTPTGTTGDATPTFTWRTVDGAAWYELWVDQLDGTSGIIHETNLTGTSFTPSSALASGDYRVWVRAISTDNETSPWSLSFDFTIADAGGSWGSADGDALLTALPDTLQPTDESPAIVAERPHQPTDDVHRRPAPVRPATPDDGPADSPADVIDAAFAWWAIRPVSLP